MANTGFFYILKAFLSELYRTEQAQKSEIPQYQDQSGLAEKISAVVISVPVSIQQTCFTDLPTTVLQLHTCTGSQGKASEILQAAFFAQLLLCTTEVFITAFYPGSVSRETSQNSSSHSAELLLSLRWLQNRHTITCPSSKL